MAGSMTPPKMPLARAQATSSTARSMSWKSIGMTPARRPGAALQEVGQPAHVAVQRGPDHVEALVGGGAEIHGRRESARQDRSRQCHLGMDPLLLEHGKTATVAIARHDPVGAVVGQPALGRRDVDAHAGEAAGGGGTDGIGLVDLTRIEAAEHGDGEIRHVAEGGDRLAVRRVHVGQEVVQAVR